MELIENLENLMASLKEDASKFFEKGNKSAGVRTRKGAQDRDNLRRTRHLLRQVRRKSEGVLEIQSQTRRRR